MSEATILAICWIPRTCAGRRQVNGSVSDGNENPRDDAREAPPAPPVQEAGPLGAHWVEKGRWELLGVFAAFFWGGAKNGPFESLRPGPFFLLRCFFFGEGRRTCFCRKKEGHLNFKWFQALEVPKLVAPRSKLQGLFSIDSASFWSIKNQWIFEGFFWTTWGDFYAVWMVLKLNCFDFLKCFQGMLSGLLKLERFPTENEKNIKEYAPSVFWLEMHLRLIWYAGFPPSLKPTTDFSVKNHINLAATFPDFDGLHLKLESLELTALGKRKLKCLGTKVMD